LLADEDDVGGFSIDFDFTLAGDNEVVPKDVRVLEEPHVVKDVLNVGERLWTQRISGQQERIDGVEILVDLTLARLQPRPNIRITRIRFAEARKLAIERFEIRLKRKEK